MTRAEARQLEVEARRAFRVLVPQVPMEEREAWVQRLVACLTHPRRAPEPALEAVHDE